MTRSNLMILVAMTSALSMVFFNQTVLSVLLPTIGKYFLASEHVLYWTINAYFLALGVLTLFGGRLGDIVGHRRVFLLGTALFAGGSLICSLAPSVWMLIFGRAFQGIAGAFLLPSTGAILMNSFPKSQRGKAMGIYISVSSAFLGVGQLVGGVLAEYGAWQQAFLVNIPVALLGLILGFMFIPRTDYRNDQTFDVGGTVRIGLGAFCLIMGFMQYKSWGLMSMAALMALSVALFSYEVFLRSSQKNRLVDFSLFKNKTFLGANLCILCGQSLVTLTIFWSLYVQNVIGFSPLDTGLLALLTTVPIFICAPIAGMLTDRFGSRMPILIGFSVLLVALMLLVVLVDQSSALRLAPTMLLFGMGISLIFSPSSVAALSQVAPENRGSASAITMFLRQFGAAASMAILSALFMCVRQSADDSYYSAFVAINLFAVVIALVGLMCGYVLMGRKAN